MGQKLGVSEKLPFASLCTQNANAVFALRLGIPKAFFQQIAGIAVTFQGTGDPQTVDIKPACCINGYPCVFCRDVLDKAFAALCTAVKNKSLLKALLEPFFLGKALFAGHGTTDVFPVDVFFGNSDIVHRSTLPYLCTFSYLLRHSDLFVFGCGLSHPSIAAHQGSHFLDVVQRERRSAQGLHGNAHELHGVVVCRRTVSHAAAFQKL